MPIDYILHNESGTWWKTATHVKIAKKKIANSNSNTHQLETLYLIPKAREV